MSSTQQPRLHLTDQQQLSSVSLTYNEIYLVAVNDGGLDLLHAD
ncbi:hypothetical protein [Vibrio diazotrophicus]